MKPPAGLGNRGRALWSSIYRSLSPGWELDEREQALLRLAARQADDVVGLEQAIKRDGRIVKGSMGQPRVHPAVVEARQGRLAVMRLLDGIELPAEDKEDGRTLASKRAQHAANARHARVLTMAERRAALHG